MVEMNRQVVHGKSFLFSFLILIGAISLVFSTNLFANELVDTATHTVAEPALIFLWIAILLFLAKTASLIERVGQPAVLGELLVGVILGSLYLVNVTFFENIKTNEIIHFLAELGVVVLLFQIGIESSVRAMVKVGVASFMVACAGVILPLVAITYVVAPMLLPNLAPSAYLFLGATMTATSVGITARVLQDIGRAGTDEARIIIGAAVIDDVLGLIILAVVAAIVQTGHITTGAVGFIVFKAVAFLGGGILLGAWFAPLLGRIFSKVHTGIGMKFVLVISFGLVFSYIASLVGLAPIVGAFTAGLVLTPVHFDDFKDAPFVDDLRGAIKDEKLSNGLWKKINRVIETHSERHILEFTEHLGHFLIPIFFVLTGMQVKIAALADTKILIMALVIFIVAMVTKVAAGIFAGRGKHKLAVGVGMIPRGEVGLIFANMGKQMGVMDDAIFSAIVIVIMLTTLITPPMLAAVFKKKA